jgi:hypothetical protein
MALQQELRVKANSPHHAAISVNSHCSLLGRYSRNTVVSSTKFPPAPKALKQTNNPSVIQDGEAPATIVKTDETNSEKLKAKRRPIISAENPQNMAPTSIPT